MSSVIRKISIGSDYKNDAMHYSVGQNVYGGHQISDIIFEEKEDGTADMLIGWDTTRAALPIAFKK